MMHRAHIRRMIAAFLALFLSLTFYSVAAAKLDIKTEVFDQDGYIRLVFDWPGRPRATAEIENGVLVIYFEEPFSTDLKYLRNKLKPYVSRVRQDDKSKTLRLALRGDLRLFTAVVDNQLALDLLPLFWRDAPPPFYGTAPDLEAVEKSIEQLGSEADERHKIAAFDPPAPYLALNVQVGERNEFTRIVFEWPELVDYELTEADGRINIAFNKNARPKLARFRVDPPKFMLGAGYKNKQKTLHVEFQIEPDVVVKHFRDGTKIAVDLWAEQRTLDVSEKPAEPEQATPPPLKVAEVDSEETASVAPTPAPKEEPKAERPVDLEAPAPREELSIAENGATNDADFHLAPKIKPGDGDVAADVIELSNVGPVAERRQPALGLSNFRVQVSAQQNQTRLRFPWPHDVETAVFRRADHIWIVFSEEAAIDLSGIDRRVKQHIVNIAELEVPQATVLRLRVPEGVFASASTEGSEWVVTIAEEKRMLRSNVPIARFAATPADTKVELELGKPATVYWLSDPEIGDDLAVVTAGATVRGVASTRKFVDFSLVETAHGVVVEPAVDDLFVGIDPDGNVVVRSLSGLSLSTPDRTAWGTGESILKFISRPAFVEVDAWKTELDFASRRQELQLAVSTADGPELESARFDLARFYVAHELPTEALGIVSLILQDNPTSENSAAVRAIRGIASLLLGRIDDAAEDLDHRLLENDPDAGLWQGLAAYRRQKMERAETQFDRSKGVLKEYPPAWRKRFALSAANALLDLNKVDAAREYLAAIPTPKSGRLEKPEVQLAHARALEAEGNSDAAIELYQEAALSSHLPSSVRAQFHSTRLLTKIESITKDEAIDRLDGLRFQWRGDALELAILSELGNLMIEQDRYRDGLAVLRTAVMHYPDEKRARSVTDDMADAFAKLYLEGEADKLPPIQALALFYDYRELTPIGHRGDDMIRRLADRLADVDLLEQAANLLSHQVENRLHGVAKAQVAARLAMVYLLDRKPEAALTTIRNTRQGRLPTILLDQRRLLEARALADLGFGEKAMDILTDDDTIEAKRLKADINWQIGEFRTAARSYEKLLGTRWQSMDPLSGPERLDVMRAAVGYALEGDEFALSRLRERYVGAMSESLDAAAFDMVTQDINRGGLEFAEVVKNIANTSTLDAFIKDVKRRYDNQNLSALN